MRRPCLYLVELCLDIASSCMHMRSLLPEKVFCLYQTCVLVFVSPRARQIRQILFMYTASFKTKVEHRIRFFDRFENPLLR